MTDKLEQSRPGMGPHTSHPHTHTLKADRAAPQPFPRLLRLSEARTYLSGLDPRTISVPPVTLRPLRFDRRQIDAALDVLCGKGATSSVAAINDNSGQDEDDIAEEIAQLDRRLAARPGAPRRRAQGR